MRRIIAIALLFLPLAGCGDGEFGRMFAPVVPGGGGGSYSAPAPQAIPRSAPGYSGGQLPATGASKMLTDPEAREESTSEYVYAYSETDARNICENIATRRGWRLDKVQPENFVNNTGKRKHTCSWTIFKEPSYEDNRHY